MIEFDTSPEGGSCKFIAEHGEGMRGFLLSTNEDRTEGVVLALMGSFEGDVKWGKMYLVVEDDPDRHPIQEKEVKYIPKDHILTNLKEDESIKDPTKASDDHIEKIVNAVQFAVKDQVDDMLECDFNERDVRRIIKRDVNTYLNYSFEDES